MGVRPDLDGVVIVIVNAAAPVSFVVVVQSGS